MCSHRRAMSTANLVQASAAKAMVVKLYNGEFERLSAAELEYWRAAEAAPVSDCLDRAMAMDAGISPLDPSMRLVGQAVTVLCMVGDNSALHAAINEAQAGDVLVASAGGFLGAAVWGGLLTETAKRKGIAGLVVDGAVRDSEEIRAAGFPCFARGIVPAGPHKNFGGAINRPIGCGGVGVSSGDLIIGDADGVTVIPFDRITETRAALEQLQAREAKARAALEAGGTLAEIYGVPEIQRVP